MNIFDYIDISRICFLSRETSKEDCLTKLVEASQDCLHDDSAFLDAILKREALMSTGLGFELAFPHSKSVAVVDFFITIGIANAGINWHSFDKQPVKMIFLIGGLIEEQDRYLRLLASLSNLLNNEEYRKELLDARTPIKFYEIFNKLALTENQAV
jgi:PTS system nitrogen regulatory IIA component